MNIQTHEELKAKIWEIANRLRGPYRPAQYRLVMLPVVVLRRLDCVLEPTKDAVLKKLEELKAQQMPEAALNRLLGPELARKALTGFGLAVCLPTLGHRAAFGDSGVRGLAALEHQPGGKAAEEIRQVYKYFYS